MEAYLIGINGRKYNMEKVGAMVFGNKNYSWKVSLIHRCYNFSGDNSGRYGPGGQFERTYGFSATREDIEDFVMTYPDGTFDLGISFDDFLLEKMNEEIIQEPEIQSIPRTNPYRYNVPNSNSYSYAQNSGAYNYGDNQAYKEGTGVMIAIGCVCAVILLILLFTGNLFKYWVLSLIVLLFTIGAFGAISILQDDDSQGAQNNNYQSYEGGYNNYKSHGNTFGSRRTAKAPKRRPVKGYNAYNGIKFNIVDRLRGKSLSSILTGILVLVLIGKILISVVITHEPISTRFWTLYIAIATTKGMIFDAKRVGLFGKLLILGLVWLVAYNYM